MKEAIKKYYEYLINTNPDFAEFVNDNKNISTDQLAKEYENYNRKSDD